MRATARQFRSQWILRGHGEFEDADYTYALSHEDAANRAIDTLALDELPEEAWVLDAGCGTGERTLALARAYPQLNVVGLDLSAGFDVLPSDWKATSNLWFVEGDIMRPPLTGATFSACLCMGVLHHMVDPAVAFDLLSEVIAPDGRLQVMVYPTVAEADPFFAASYRFRDRYGAMLRRLPSRLRLWAVDRGARSLRDLVPANWDELPAARERVLRFWLHDQVMPERQWRIARAEIANLFERNAFPQPTDLGHGTYVAHRKLDRKRQ